MTWQLFNHRRAITAAAAVAGTAASIDAARKAAEPGQGRGQLRRSADAAAAYDQQYNRANQRAATGNHASSPVGTMLTEPPARLLTRPRQCSPAKGMQ